MIVYWTPYVMTEYMNELAQLNFERVLNDVNKRHVFDHDDRNNYKKCPAFKKIFEEMYALKFATDCDLNFHDDLIWSDERNENFIKTQIRIRSEEKRIFGFNQFYLFFAEKSLEMSFYHPFFEDNDFTKSAYLIPGRYDIGKWIRPIECSFIVRKDASKLQIKTGDTYGYLQFHTDEKLTFKKFHVTTEMKAKMTENIRFHKEKKPFKTLIPFYEIFERSKQRTWFLNQIKQNLME